MFEVQIVKYMFAVVTSVNVVLRSTPCSIQQPAHCFALWPFMPYSHKNIETNSIVLLFALNFDAEQNLNTECKF